MDDVEAHVAGTALPEDRVEVGPVVVHDGTHIVQHRGDLLDALFEQAERVGVREHEPGHLVVDQRSQGPHVHQTARVRRNADRLEPGETNAGRVRTVGGVGDQHLGPLAPTVGVHGAHDQQAGHLPARPGRGLQRGPRHAGDLAQRPFQAPEQLEHALHGRVGLQRMQPLESGHGRDGLRCLGVVLHRA